MRRNSSGIFNCFNNNFIFTTKFKTSGLIKKRHPSTRWVSFQQLAKLD